MGKNNAKIAELYDQARQLALADLESLARDILKKRPNYKEFIMAMGSCFFTTKRNGETVDLTPDDECFSDMHALLSEWDEYLKLTGEPMRFTVDGPRKTDW